MIIQRGDVWFVKFPLDEDMIKTINRPVLVLDEDKLEVLCTKITRHSPRSGDKYDVPILYWQHAKLRFSSTARVSKTMHLGKFAFVHKIGTLHPNDFRVVEARFMDFIQSQE